VYGGSSVLAGFFRGTVAHTRGLRDVAVAAKLSEPMDEAVNAALIDLGDARVRLLPGLANPSQAPALDGAWEAIGAHLEGLDDAGMDVLVDLGRWGARHGPEPLAAVLDLLVVVTTSDLPGIHAARGWVPVLTAELDALGRGAAVLRALVVGPDRPYSSREIAAALSIPVIADVPWDPSTAATLSHGEPPPRGGRSPLGRALPAAAAALAAAVLNQARAGQEATG
jgi:MinD-like ATPase involved in chromosome partitioning or flagellar assembly